jgi:hypothetical protein
MGATTEMRPATQRPMSGGTKKLFSSIVLFFGLVNEKMIKANIAAPNASLQNAVVASIGALIYNRTGL